MSLAAEKALIGQVAVVTGAARGVGRAIAARLGEMGATVVLVARSREGLEAIQAEIATSGGQAAAIPCDLRDPQAVESLAAGVRARFGRCDILINNAGIGNQGRPLHEMSTSDWDALMETNLRGPFFMVRSFVPMMIEAQYGHIINISSLAGKNPLPNGAAYSASKWGLNGLTYSIAEELRPHNIRAAIVAPGSINTKFDSGPGWSGKDPATKIQPEDIAAVVALLVTQSPQSFISEVLVRPTKK